MSLPFIQSLYGTPLTYLCYNKATETREPRTADTAGARDREGDPDMTENTTQDERWYRVEHRVSGFDAGLFRAHSPEEAIARMMDDACCTDQPSPDWIATDEDR